MSDPYVLKNGVFILKGGKAGSGVPLESHVIPHGNTSVGAELDELSQNLTQFVPIWNPTDDYYYVNGKRSIKAWLNSVPVFVDGVFGIDMTNGVNFAEADTGITFDISGSNIIRRASSTTNKKATLVSDELIDFTNYSKVIVKSNVGVDELNVSALNESAYVAVWANQTTASTNNSIVGIVASRAKQNFGDASNRIVFNNITLTSNADIVITEIAIE